MQFGAMARLKMAVPEDDKMTTWIFGGGNRRDRVPRELLSGFPTFAFKPSTREELLKVAQGVITGQVCKHLGLAK